MSFSRAQPCDTPRLRFPLAPAHAARLLAAAMLRVAANPNHDAKGRFAPGHSVSITSIDQRFPLATATVDGRAIPGFDDEHGPDIPNMSSIKASLGRDYEVLDGVREVKVADFEDNGIPSFYSQTEEARVKALAATIAHNQRITPLIVVVDTHKSPYVLEGGHRFDALKLLGAKSFPALVVVDTSELKVLGGAGSGNYGHAGRPGEVGGSGATGSPAWIKMQDAAALMNSVRKRLIEGGQATDASSDEDLLKISTEFQNTYMEWERLRHAFTQQEHFDKVQRRAESVAHELGVDPAVVHVVDIEPRTFTLDGRQLREAGHYNPADGQVEINARNSYDDRMSVTNGIVAHELSHVMYDTVKKEQEREHHEILSLSMEETNRLFRMNGYPRDEVIGELRQQFPASAAFADTWGDSFLSPELKTPADLHAPNSHVAMRDQMVSENGHSVYAKSWWAAKNDSRWPADSALNETLAEVTRFRTHPLSWHETDTPAPKSPCIQLSKDIQAAYHKIKKS